MKFFSFTTVGRALLVATAVVAVAVGTAVAENSAWKPSSAWTENSTWTQTETSGGVLMLASDERSIRAACYESCKDETDACYEEKVQDYRNNHPQGWDPPMAKKAQFKRECNELCYDPCVSSQL